jgi:hypothetical protein
MKVNASRVNEYVSAIGALRQGMNDKMSIGKVYGMKSLIGDWWASVYSGRGANGSTMAIVDKSVVDFPGNNAVWWTFQEKP